MDMVFRRAYTGPLQAVILDWAGTTVDYGSRAPVAAVVALFGRHGVRVTEAQARAPMGRHKKEHLRAVAAMPEVAAQWQAARGRPFNEDDLDALFAEFIPVQIDCLARHADVIPGVPETVADFRRRGLLVGSTTGYTRELMAAVAPEAKRRGYEPDAMICPSDVPAGRPQPWMCYQNAIALRRFPISAFVKVGDTPVDIEEGLNARMWTIGLTRCGNELGLSQAEVDALPRAEREGRLRAAASRLRHAGAHYVVETLADVPPVLDVIESRLQRGEQP